MIVIPFIFIALIIGIIAIVKTIMGLKSKVIELKDIFLGLCVSLSIFGLIALGYITEGSAWAFSPAFRIPIFMVFIPFVVYIIAAQSKNEKIKYLRKLPPKMKPTKCS